jgi:hypothetical protein
MLFTYKDKVYTVQNINIYDSLVYLLEKFDVFDVIL